MCIKFKKTVALIIANTNHSLYDIATDGTSPAIVESEIIRRVEAHTGRRADNWQVTVTSHVSPDKKQPTMQLITLSHIADRVFVLANALVVEAEPNLPVLLRKISAYAPKLSRNVRGTEYDYVDFGVRVGMSLDKQGAAMGVVVEIEYRPCSSTSDCELLIAELMDRIAAPLVPPPQASEDPDVSKAATSAYTYVRVELDPNKFSPKDLIPFSDRTEALMYAKLLT